MSQCIGLNILPRHSELVKNLYKMAANHTCHVNDMTTMLKQTQKTTLNNLPTTTRDILITNNSETNFEDEPAK